MSIVNHLQHSVLNGTRNRINNSLYSAIYLQVKQGVNNFLTRDIGDIVWEQIGVRVLYDVVHSVEIKVSYDVQSFNARLGV